jgi:hypothetical protein
VPGREARLKPRPRRFARWTALACRALLSGAGLGFLARDLLELGQPAVALAWLAGIALGITTGRGGE